MKRSKRNNRKNAGWNKSQRNNNNLTGTMSEDVKLPRAMMYRPGKVTKFQFRGNTQITTDGSGKINTFIPCDPSATLDSTYLSGQPIFAEWNSYKTLFTEVKFVQLDIRIASSYTYDGKQASVDPMVISSIVSSLTGRPGGYQTVYDNGDAQQFPYALNNTASSKFHALRFRPSAWASVTAPNPGSSSGISAGCPGCIYLYAEGGPATQNVMHVGITGTYLFRNRA